MATPERREGQGVTDSRQQQLPLVVDTAVRAGVGCPHREDTTMTADKQAKATPAGPWGGVGALRRGFGPALGPGAP